MLKIEKVAVSFCSLLPCPSTVKRTKYRVWSYIRAFKQFLSHLKTSVWQSSSPA